jgi:hypothetical protein
MKVRDAIRLIEADGWQLVAAVIGNSSTRPSQAE